MMDDLDIAKELTIKALDAGTHPQSLPQLTDSTDPEKIGEFVGKLYKTILKSIRSA